MASGKSTVAEALARVAENMADLRPRIVVLEPRPDSSEMSAEEAVEPILAG